MINLNTILYSLANSDKKALEKLFDYYYPRLYNFSKSFLKSEDGIDDILQEVFVKIWKNRTNIRTSITFNQFIYTITRNMLLNELRSRLNEKKTKDAVHKISMSQEYLPLAEIEYQELEKAVGRMINNLPEKQREVFILSRQIGLSHKDIARELDISTKTVEYHICQSIRRIKFGLDELGLISLFYFFLFL